MDSSLVSQCLAFCQTLADQGKAFNFKLTNTSFSFSLDTKGINAKSSVDKRRISPSTQRRNARRREEFPQPPQLGLYQLQLQLQPLDPNTTSGLGTSQRSQGQL